MRSRLSAAFISTRHSGWEISNTEFARHQVRLGNTVVSMEETGATECFSASNDLSGIVVPPRPGRSRLEILTVQNYPA